MNIHEHQAKTLLAQYGVPVPRGKVAHTWEEVERVAEELGPRVVIKAQIHAGGRGKSGGVRFASDPRKAGEYARELLGSRLVTAQTDSEGAPVNTVLIEEALNISEEYFLAVTMDAEGAAVSVTASAVGGMDIEAVATEMPDKIVRRVGDPLTGFAPYKARLMAVELCKDPIHRKAVQGIILSLCRIFKEKDCSLIELNPLAITAEGQVLAADAKIGFEDDALFRHPELLKMQDMSQMNELEVRAADAKLAYIRMDDGSVGCMVNGAGLAMATMDMIKSTGAAPANFLDVGGSTNREKIEEAYRIIASDSRVRILLINLFAGISRSDIVAEGIVSAAEALGRNIPIIALMRGSAADKGLNILKNSGLNVTAVSDLIEAADVLKRISAEVSERA